MDSTDDFTEPIITWFAANARDLPWRNPNCTAWGVLVSEFMLQQTPVHRVLERFSYWLTRWPTPAALAAEPAGEAVRAWQKLGYPRRALWLHRCAVIIVEQHNGIVPQQLDDLLHLPGVGEYTARAVASFAYGQRQPVVDTNIRRVIARAVYGFAEADPPHTNRDLAAMQRLLPADEEKACRYSAGMMELGALVCTARNPQCQSCPIAGLCAWRKADYPANSAKRKVVQKKYHGSNRQIRGIILAKLRETTKAVSATEITVLWPDSSQLGQALTELIADGLIVEANDGYSLPS